MNTASENSQLIGGKRLWVPPGLMPGALKEAAHCSLLAARHVSLSHSVKRQIRESLAELQPRSIDYPYTDSAAVLMPIVQVGSDDCFLLTKRTDTVGTHKGQISFPGGRRDGDEPLEITALRETEEELGIFPEAIEVVGRFHEYLAITEWRVVPFVGFVEMPPRLQLNPGEVEKVILAPLSFFALTQPRVEKRRRLGHEVRVLYYDFDGEVIWGLTARIIRDFMKLLERLNL